MNQKNKALTLVYAQTIYYTSYPFTSPLHTLLFTGDDLFTPLYSQEMTDDFEGRLCFVWGAFVWGFGVLFLCVCAGLGGVVLCRCLCACAIC